MRVLGFCKRWPKLSDVEFTTFRYPRRDKDWQRGEVVQVVIRPRIKEREPLGVAMIMEKESKIVRDITDEESRIDGFPGLAEMHRFLKLKAPDKLVPINKLTVRWSALHNPLIDQHNFT